MPHAAPTMWEVAAALPCYLAASYRHRAFCPMAACQPAAPTGSASTRGTGSQGEPMGASTCPDLHQDSMPAAFLMAQPELPALPAPHDLPWLPSSCRYSQDSGNAAPAPLLGTAHLQERAGVSAGCTHGALQPHAKPCPTALAPWPLQEDRSLTVSAQLLGRKQRAEAANLLPQRAAGSRAGMATAESRAWGHHPAPAARRGTGRGQCQEC